MAIATMAGPITNRALGSDIGARITVAPMIAKEPRTKLLNVMDLLPTNDGGDRAAANQRCHVIPTRSVAPRE